MIIFSNDVIIRGKKAQKYQELSNKYGFLYIDIYLMSGVLGFINHQKDVQDNDDLFITIPRNVLQNRAEKIDFLYQIVTLSEEIDLDSEKAMKLAFEENSIASPKLYKRELFEDYAMGGIDLLYNLLSDVVYDKQVDNIKDILDQFYEQSNLGEKSIEDILEEEGL